MLWLHWRQYSFDLRSRIINHLQTSSLSDILSEFLWYFSHRLIFFGGYGYAAQGPHLGTFEYDESSSLVVCKTKDAASFNQCIVLNLIGLKENLSIFCKEFSNVDLKNKYMFFFLLVQWDSPGRGWNNHIHILDLETSTWSQPITTVNICHHT